MTDKCEELLAWNKKEQERQEKLHAEYLALGTLQVNALRLTGAAIIFAALYGLGEAGEDQGAWGPAADQAIEILRDLERGLAQ